MFLVGLTGGIASGKSTVSGMLQKEGCVIIDADIIARQVVSVNSKGWQLVRQHFGNDICDSDGNIDRAKLGDIIFTDPAQRRQLNAITHPLIFRRILWEVFCNLVKCRRYVILDIPLLNTDSSSFYILSEVVVVHCNEDIQLQRLMERNNLTETEARQRISSQIPPTERKNLATNELCLVDNNEGIQSTHGQVLKLRRYLDSSWRPEIFRLICLCIPSLAYWALFH